jgi:hypothetical protein
MPLSPLSDLPEDAPAEAQHEPTESSALEQFPAEYWVECDRLQRVALETWKAVYANIIVKASGYAFAVVALVPGHHTFFEGPARSDRLDAWKAFIDLRKDAA